MAQIDAVSQKQTVTQAQLTLKANENKPAELPPADTAGSDAAVVSLSKDQQSAAQDALQLAYNSKGAVAQLGGDASQPPTNSQSFSALLAEETQV